MLKPWMIFRINLHIISSNWIIKCQLWKCKSSDCTYIWVVSVSSRLSGVWVNDILHIIWWSEVRIRTLRQLLGVVYVRRSNRFVSLRKYYSLCLRLAKTVVNTRVVVGILPTSSEKFRPAAITSWSMSGLSDKLSSWGAVASNLSHRFCASKPTYAKNSFFMSSCGRSPIKNVTSGRSIFGRKTMLCGREVKTMNESGRKCLIQRLATRCWTCCGVA